MLISAIITGHQEKLLCGPSIRSYHQAAAHARNAGIQVEAHVVLDRPDDLTRAMFEQTGLGEQLEIVNFGDPAASRNAGTRLAKGDFVTFLDADDLWSFNWIEAAYRFCQAQKYQVVAHSEINVFFGGEQTIWAHVDSEAPDFEPGYLGISNYWDALCFASRELLWKFPFVVSDLKAGYGHEDWHWNNVTLYAGIAHRPVPDTVHFKRRRPNSRLIDCSNNDVVVWPTDIAVYEKVESLKQRENM